MVTIQGHDVEVLGITFIFADRSNLGGDEVSGQVLSGGSCEDAMDGNPEYGGEEIEDLALWSSLVG